MGNNRLKTFGRQLSLSNGRKPRKNDPSASGSLYVGVLRSFSFSNGSSNSTRALLADIRLIFSFL